MEELVYYGVEDVDEDTIIDDVQAQWVLTSKSLKFQTWQDKLIQLVKLFCNCEMNGVSY